LLEARRLNNRTDTAIIRVEQLYPLPGKIIDAELDKYTQTNELIWCQEEPKNQGAWYFLHSRLRNRATAKQRVFYAGRPEYAAPAEGLLYSHKVAQAELVDTASTMCLGQEGAGYLAAC